MGIRQTAFSDKEIAVEVEWYGETAMVKVRPGRLTDDWFKRMAELRAVRRDEETDADAELRKAYGLFAEVVADVDVTDDDGEPVPLTYELFDSLPPSFVSEVMTMVMTGIPAEEGKG